MFGNCRLWLFSLEVHGKFHSFYQSWSHKKLEPIPQFEYSKQYDLGNPFYINSLMDLSTAMLTVPVTLKPRGAGRRGQVSNR